MKYELLIRSALTLAIFLPTFAQAFQLSPLNAVLRPSGAGASQTFELENKSDKPIPIEVSVIDRTQDLDGKDVPNASASAEEKFVVYPPQFILDPKSVRSVKVSWIGSSEIVSEQAYRVNFAQLSVPLEKQPKTAKPEAKIDLLLDYSASVYVSPLNAAPKLMIISGGPSPKDPSKLELLIENQGTAHQMLKGFTAKLNGVGEHRSKVSEEDTGAPFEKNVLAGSKLHILVAWPKDLPKGPVSGEFVPKL